MQMGNASQVAVLGQSRRNVLEANQKKEKQKKRSFPSMFHMMICYTLHSPSVISVYTFLFSLF